MVRLLSGIIAQSVCTVSAIDWLSFGQCCHSKGTSRLAKLMNSVKISENMAELVLTPLSE